MPAAPMILTPIKLGSVEVRNRTVITAHGASEMFRNPRLAPEPYIEYLRRRAAGGVGLIIAQALYVNPLGEYPAELTDRHHRLAEAVRAEGATLMLQLVHLGATFRSDSDVHRPPLWGFSTTVTDYGDVAHAMTDEQIEMMIAGYGRIAAMAAAAGFDGCEIHGAHGYIGQQSLSPWLNQREDKWGQDRTLFVRRLIEVVRAEIGPSRILGYRTATDDMKSPEDGGLGVAGVTATVKAILATGEIDVLNTTVGHGGKTYTRAIPSYRWTEAPNMPKAKLMREAIAGAVPVIGVGRIASVGIAESLLQAGDCDLVAMTRAHIADPDIVAKIQRSETHRVRPCVGALVCNSRKLAGYSEISCVHNPEVMREHELVTKPVEAGRSVVVVGAGPAGLKSAEIAAKRGHQVRILDRAERTGGLLRFTEFTAASDLASTVDHLVSELSILGITPELGISVDDDLLASIAPDFVVVATGAEPPHEHAFLGSESAHVVSGPQALAGEVDHDVVVFDAIGASEGALVAEALADRGHHVTLVTPYELVMPYAGISHRMETPDILRRKLGAIITEGLVGAVAGRTVTVVRADGETIVEVDAGTIVAITAPSPRLELVAALERLGVPYALAGDVVAPRTAMEAFRDGEEVALRI
jgi:2,4-dienoyl-CoA reductase-like NADH-dependent reductase (Old Yellow Enzyme family)